MILKAHSRNDPGRQSQLRMPHIKQLGAEASTPIAESLSLIMSLDPLCLHFGLMPLAAVNSPVSHPNVSSPAEGTASSQLPRLDHLWNINMEHPDLLLNCFLIPNDGFILDMAIATNIHGQACNLDRCIKIPGSKLICQ